MHDDNFYGNVYQPGDWLIYFRNAKMVSVSFVRYLSGCDNIATVLFGDGTERIINLNRCFFLCAKEYNETI